MNTNYLFEACVSARCYVPKLYNYKRQPLEALTLTRRIESEIKLYLWFKIGVKTPQKMPKYKVIITFYIRL